MNNITNFELLQLVGGTSWEEKQQRDFINKYVITLLGFINENLNGKIKSETEEYFSQIIKKTPYSEEEIKDFFKKNYPGLDQVITDLVIDFKKQFVISVYQEKIRELSANITSDTLLIKWKKILERALTDDWEGVTKLMKE